MDKNDYNRNQLNSVIKVSALYSINYYRFGNFFATPKLSQNFWRLIFIDKGKAQIFSNGKQFILSEGELCFHKPNELNSLSSNNDTVNAIIISFEASGRMMNFFQNRIFSADKKEIEILKNIINESKESYLGMTSDLTQSKLTKTPEAPFGSEQVIKNSLELFLISLVRKNFHPKIAKNIDNTSVSVHAEQMVEAILEILNSRVTSSVDLDTIAKELFFSKTYIKTIFKKYVGTSIIQYYNNLKIEKAKQLIAQKQYSITEITAMLGFSSVHYFSRLFKQITDLSPSEYAKTLE